MKKYDDISDQLRPEYDIKKVFSNSTKGKYAGTSKRIVVSIDFDLVDRFPDSESVNKALRKIVST